MFLRPRRKGPLGASRRRSWKRLSQPENHSAATENYLVSLGGKIGQMAAIEVFCEDSVRRTSSCPIMKTAAATCDIFWSSLKAEVT